MTDLLEPLAPIADIVGENAVKASYSDDAIYRDGAHRPGWKVEINTMYRGAHVQLSEKADTLDDAAAAALKRLKSAVGLK